MIGERELPIVGLVLIQKPGPVGGGVDRRPRRLVARRKGVGVLRARLLGVLLV